MVRPWYLERIGGDLREYYESAVKCMMSVVWAYHSREMEHHENT